MKRRGEEKSRRRRNPGDFESPDAARPSELTLTHMDGQRRGWGTFLVSLLFVPRPVLSHTWSTFAPQTVEPLSF